MPSGPKIGNDLLHLRSVAAVGEMRAALDHVEAGARDGLGDAAGHGHGREAVLGARDHLDRAADAAAVVQPLAAAVGLVEQRQQRGHRVAAQRAGQLRVPIGPRLEPGQRVLAHAQAHVGVEVLLEAPRLHERPLARPPGLVLGGRHEGRPADRHHAPARAPGAWAAIHSESAAAHGGAAPHRLADPEAVEPVQQVLGLARVGVVLDPLEARGEPVAARVRERARARGRRTARDPRTMTEESSTEPPWIQTTTGGSDGARGQPGLPPVEADAGGQDDFRQGPSSSPGSARSGTWSRCRPSRPPR